MNHRFTSILLVALATTAALTACDKAPASKDYSNIVTVEPTPVKISPVKEETPKIVKAPSTPPAEVPEVHISAEAVAAGLITPDGAPVPVDQLPPGVTVIPNTPEK